MTANTTLGEFDESSPCDGHDGQLKGRPRSTNPQAKGSCPKSSFGDLVARLIPLPMVISSFVAFDRAVHLANTPKF
jgi:hypothetical protein